MKTPLITSLAAGFIVLLTSCARDSTAPANAPLSQADTEAVLQFEGTVIHKNIEGGFYAIESDDEQKYNPINLPEQFREDGLKVKVTARPAEGMSIHMYGQLIEILEISSR